MAAAWAAALMVDGQHNSNDFLLLAAGGLVHELAVAAAGEAGAAAGAAGEAAAAAAAAADAAAAAASAVAAAPAGAAIAAAAPALDEGGAVPEAHAAFALPADAPAADAPAADALPADALPALAVHSLAGSCRKIPAPLFLFATSSVQVVVFVAPRGAVVAFASPGTVIPHHEVQYELKSSSVTRSIHPPSGSCISP